MINLILGNCLERMNEIPDGSIDAIICDLPYGTTQNKWDSVICLSSLWNNYKRIIKPKGAIILTAQTPFDKVLGVSNLGWLKYEFIWVKNIATGHLNANRAPMKKHENVLVFANGQPTYNPQMTRGVAYTNKRKPIDDNGDNYGKISARTDTINTGTRYPVSVLNFNCEKGLHPTQKPVALMEYFIKTYTNEGDTVLDNCAGSFSTGVACVNTNRKFIGIEKDETYFNIGTNRLNDTIKNRIS